jgi:hypothetical protein
MNHDLSRRTNAELLHGLHSLVARDRATTAALLAHLAEVEARGLHVAQGYASLFVYCVEPLGFSEDVAWKRIQAARAARRFPMLFNALADGRLHLTAVGLLAPYLEPGNVDELVRAATHARKAAIERFLSRRFPRMEALVRGMPAVRSAPPETVPQLGPVVEPAPAQAPVSTPSTNGAAVDARFSHEVAAEPPRSTPWTDVPAVDGGGEAGRPDLAPALHVLRVTIGQETCDKLERARSFLRHSIPDGDVAAVLDRALDAHLERCEKRKFAAAAATAAGRPRAAARPTVSKRHVPAAVRRAVWRRDGGRCTFVSASGRRCASADFLEFDHVDPVARGGNASEDRIRLLCRAHNQHAAERAFGSAFMRDKRLGRNQVARSRRDPGAEPAGDGRLATAKPHGP